MKELFSVHDINGKILYRININNKKEEDVLYNALIDFLIFLQLNSEEELNDNFLSIERGSIDE